MSSPGRGSSHRSVALLGSLSVVVAYLALGEGPPGFGPGFTCPTLLGYQPGPKSDVAYGAFTRSGASFQTASAITLGPKRLTPRPHRDGPDGLGWSPFARRY